MLVAMIARYIAVKIDEDTLRLDDTQTVLVPIGAARLYDDDDIVVIRAGIS